MAGAFRSVLICESVNMVRENITKTDIAVKDYYGKSANTLQAIEHQAVSGAIPIGYAVLVQTVGGNIVRLRKSRKLSQVGLADLLETRQPAVWKLEHAKQVPGGKTLLRVAKALQCSVEELLEGVDDGYDIIVANFRRIDVGARALAASYGPDLPHSHIVGLPAPGHAALSVQPSSAPHGEDRSIHTEAETITEIVSALHAAIARLDEQASELRTATSEALAETAKFRRQATTLGTATPRKSARARKRG